MEQEFVLEYVVVEFITDKSLAVIPKNWLQEIYAAFPPYTNAWKVKSAAKVERFQPKIVKYSKSKSCFDQVCRFGHIQQLWLNCTEFK